jgi:hypothetical protein
MRSYLKTTLHQKKAGEVAQGIGPEFKPQYFPHKIDKRMNTYYVHHKWGQSKKRWMGGERW